MANINVNIRSLWGAAIFRTYSVDPATTKIDDLITLIAADDNLDTNYYRITLSRDHTINDLAYGDSTATLNDMNFVDGDSLVTSVKKLNTKQERQIQKLDISQAKRQADGDTTARYYRSANIYDIDDLPTKYSGNDKVDNPNAGGLLANRPWTSSTEGP